MNTHNFTLVNFDTDSITICKEDQAPFSEEEKDKLLLELNSLFPDRISWEDDGEYECILVIKAKNYALYDGEKIKIKGSGLKASTKCVALKEYIKKCIDILIYTPSFEQAISDLHDYYMLHVNEICNIKDIKRWAARKTYSSTLAESDATVCKNIMKAISGTDYREGDRFYTFYRNDDSVCLVENFNGDYNKKRLLENLFDTTMIFDSVIPDAKAKFLNYSLKRNERFLPGYVAPPVKIKEPRKKKTKVEENVENPA